MSPIKDFSLTYEDLNDEHTFSEGDTLTGAVAFTLTKETKVKSLFLKVKGDANVRWTEGSGDDETTYSAHRRYFKLKNDVIAANDKGTVLSQGVHCFKFRFKIPQGDMPSSFKGLHGKIVYMLEAKMSRRWRWPSKVQKELHFVSKSFPRPGQVMCPQSGSVDKKMGIFSKGQVQMSATVNRNVCSPGDTLSVVAKIHNSSSKQMRPKFSLQQKTVYRANGSTKTSDKSLCKMVGDTITLNSEETLSCQLKIPADVVHTLHNCEILSVDYYLKVYLDIKFAIDPEVVLPLVIVPSSIATLHLGKAVGPYPAGAIGGPSNSDFPPPAASMGPYPAGAIGGPSNSDFPPPAASMGPYPAGAIGGPSNSDFPPPAASMGPYPAAAHSGSYGDPGDQRYSAPPPVYAENPPVYAGPPGVYPAQSAHMSGGYPVPQLACPYGPPFSSSSSSSSVLHPAPPALTFQPPPCAPEIHPLPSSQPFNISSTAPTYNLLPSAPTMNTDFLSQSDEAPPAYSILFPSSATEKSDVK